MIAAVALTVVVLFFFPWLEGTNNLTGLDIATQNLILTEQYPSGVLFILPLVAGSILYQYYRRIRQAVRPRRRLTTSMMLIIGLSATILWLRTYAVNARDQLNDNLLLFSVTNAEEEIRTEPYTIGEVLSEQVRFELWLHLAMGTALLVLPFVDPRPPADPPEI
jgi:hypothetical protein